MNKVDFVDLLAEWGRDPALFITDFFGEKPDPLQLKILRALTKSNKIAIRSGHGVGKTWLAARGGLWFFVTRPYSKVITTAPTWHQVRKILWSEIHSALRKVPPILKANFEVLDMDIYMKDANGERIQEWYITGRSSDKAEYMQGFHAPYLLYIIDEASGVDNKIYEAIEGSQTTEAKILMIGNPLRAEGYFYDAFHKNRDLWDTYHLSCLESPRVSRKWIEERKREWGEESILYKIKVLGEFPDIISNALIPLYWVESAKIDSYSSEKSTHEQRWYLIDKQWASDPTVEIRIGVDVARMGGDETVITVIGQKGNTIKVFEIISAQGKETTWTARRTKRLYEKYNTKIVNVDDTGVGGGVTDLLKEEGVKVNPIKFGASPTNSEAKMLFLNLKAQIYYTLKDYFDPSKEERIIIPDHPKLIRDLSALKQDYTSKDKIKIIDPPKSPDYSDSLALAVTRVGRRELLKPPSIFLR